MEEDLKSEISGHFLKGCLGLLMIPDEYDATCLYNAMKVFSFKSIVDLILLF